jgi:ubiquinone/menaquinone biosynthesis C-methylase UbiE
VAFRAIAFVNFDRVADHYYWLELLAFGSALQRARTHWLAKLTQPSRVLIVGEGNGRFLCELLKMHPEIEIDCIDASARMLRLAEKRLRRKAPDTLPQVRFLHHDVRTWSAPIAAYDLVIAHFFLDCYEEIEVSAIVKKLAAVATKHATWLIADFCLPPKEIARTHARLWLFFMYRFFRTFAGIPGRWLVDPAPFLKASGFELTGSYHIRFGMVKSEIWLKTGCL